MSMSVDLINLRKRVADATRLGVVSDENKSIYEATLIQILNESERQRLRCHNMIEDFKRKAAQAEAQANAYSQMSSIIYNVINGFVQLAEKGQAEEAEAKEEKEMLKQAEIVVEKQKPEAEPEPAPKKKTTRKATRRKRR